VDDWVYLMLLNVPPPLVPPELVRGIIAGGIDALTRSIEGAEDRHVDGEQAITENGINGNDIVVGIATGGTTPFVHGALAQANRLKATTVFLCCNPDISPAEVLTSS